MESKRWYESKTMIGLLGLICLTLLYIFKVPIPTEFYQLLGLIAGGTTVIGMRTADSKISLAK